MTSKIPSIASYLDTVAENCMLSKNTPPLVMPLVEMVDQLFREDLLVSEAKINPYARMLSMHAYAMFMAAVRQALSAHCAAVPPLARAVLESACYAHLISRNDSLGKIWAERHKDDESAKASRNKFSSAVSEVAKTYENDDPKFSAVLKEIYLNHIDAGAHPNPRGVLSYTSIQESESLRTFNLTVLQDPKGFEVNRSLLSCCDTAIAAAMVIHDAFDEHPKDEIERFTSAQQLMDKFIEILAKEVGIEVEETL